LDTAAGEAPPQEKEASENTEQKDAEAAEEEKRRAEEEQKIGYEEFLKVRETKLAKIPLPEPRKPGEGTEDQQWAKYFELKRPDEEDKKEKKAKKPVAPAPAGATPAPTKPVAIDTLFNVVDNPQAKSKKPNKAPNQNKAKKEEQNEVIFNEQNFPALAGKPQDTGKPQDK